MFTLAIVGRPNVGKSTLFNRLAGKQLAIVDDTPGVTRDWREAGATLFGHSFKIIDTAGLEENFDDSIQGRMRKQTENALRQADAVLFVIDGRSGITPLDQHFAQWLRKQKKPVVLVVNKAENDKAVMSSMGDAYSLGLGSPIALSSAHGIGMDDLFYALQPYFNEDEENEEERDQNGINLDHLDDIEGIEDFEFEAEEDDPQKPIKIAIAGRPNVGKSTLLNAIVKDERVMTGPEAGITRDAIAVDWEYEGRPFKLVDTAGMRKKAKVVGAIEKMSVDDSMRAVRLAQVVILVIDANSPLEKQDLHIAGHIVEEGRALVIAVNKWDTIRDKDELLEEMQYKLETSLGQVKDVRFIPISALHGRNIEKLFKATLKTYEFWNLRTSTGKLNRWLSKVESQNAAPLVHGRSNRLKYITQVKTRPPTFAIWVSQPKELPNAYRRYLINALRRDFDIQSVPIRLMVRTSKNPYGNKGKK
ncbi:MAG: ribosome biogenesis GTPase Der [Micavibrio sp.]|nr:ribosome biogenesis GTPase Der [Micavibrio sp.]|tara:strand:+ start:551 stop:1975 length:1425 start_codon:yes stop_codon:yes gene_type:complete